MKKIVVPFGLKKEIFLALGCSYPTIVAALDFKSDTHLAKQIRIYALTHGGALYTSNEHPINCIEI